MKNKVTVPYAITRAITAKGPMKPRELTATTGKLASRVYTALSLMVKNGRLTRLDDGRYALADAPALTAIKPEVVQPKTDTSLANRLAKAEAEIDNLQAKLQDATIKYYDTLAVLRYLESKLTITKRT